MTTIAPLPPFEFHTTPFRHQAREFTRTRATRTFAYFWEQGTGKSKIILDVARDNWARGVIDALLVTAPSGVHANWMDQAETHLPPTCDWQGMVWWPSVARSYWAEVKRGMRTFVDQRHRFLILATSYHAFQQDRSVNIIKQFLAERRVLWALDESDDIGNPMARWTRKILSLRDGAVMRRVATGTPYKDGTPLAYWSQFQFLHPAIIGLPWRAYKVRYARWRRTRFPGARWDTLVPVKDPKTGIQVFQNLEELYQKTDLRTSRVTKAEALPELPAKMYEKVYVPLSDEQRRAYDLLRDESIIQFTEDRAALIEMALTRRLRLQQIVCGFYPVDGEEPERVIPGPQPRLDTLVEEVLRSSGQVIVWARFRMDLDCMVPRLAHHTRVGRYDGTTHPRDRERAKLAFLAGDIKVLCANQAAMSRGHTFVNSAHAIYYSNYTRLLLREQSEDRQHRIGTRTSVRYTDLVAPGTTDELDLQALRSKKNVADYLLSRPLEEWI